MPGISSRMPASTSATPRRMATCASCPQACMTPTSCPLNVVRTVDLNGTSTCSVTGSASMSARSATTRPGLPPLQDADDAGVRDRRLHLDAELAQAVGDELRRARLAVAELGMLVNVAAAGDDFRLDLLRGVVDALIERGGGVERCGHEDLQSEDGEQAHFARFVDRAVHATAARSRRAALPLCESARRTIPRSAFRRVPRPALSSPRPW